MTQQEMRIKTGIDNSMIAGGMRDLNAQVKSGSATAVASFKAMGDEARGFGKILKGFGISGLINQTVSVLKPATEAVATFFGKFVGGGFEAEARLEAMARGLDKFTAIQKKLNKERNEDEKAAAETVKKIQDKALEQRLLGKSEEDQLAIKEELFKDAVRKRDFIFGGTEKEKRQRELDALSAQIEYEKSLYDMGEKRQKQKDKDAEQIKKQEDLNEKIFQNELERLRLEKILKDELNKMDSLRDRNDLEPYMSSIDEIAGDNNSRGQYRAKEVQRMEADTKRVLRQFGANADPEYLRKNQEYKDKNLKSLRDDGFLPDDKFESIKTAAEDTSSILGRLEKEGITLKQKP